jgi:actin related protein 2/3 complex subunit 1A/1B
VSAVDWHPETNSIISASHDRNILVFTYNSSKNTWIPDIVHLNHRLAVLDVKWSVRGDKFVAATGSKLIATGYYSSEQNWWTCKQSKEHRSSVTTVRFDSTGLFILSGSTDLRAYITSAYIPEVDDKFTYDNLPFPMVIKLIILRKTLEKLFINYQQTAGLILSVGVYQMNILSSQLTILTYI